MKTPGVAGMPLLKMGISARGIAMSDSFSSISDDITSVYYNPAGIGQIKGFQIQFNRINWFLDTTIDSVAIGKSYNNMNGWAIEYRSLLSEDYVRDTQTINNETTVVTGDKINFHNSVIGLTFAGNSIIGEQMDRNFRVGCTLKIINQEIYTKQYSAIGYDIGILYGPDSRSNYYSVVLQNIGDNIGQDILPSILRIGTGYKDNTYAINAEAVQEIDTKIKLTSGLEFYIGKVFTLRFGGMLQNESFSYTGGFGLSIKSFQLDYGFMPHSDLGDTSRISLTIKL